MSEYTAPVAPSRAEIREKGSVFLAVLAPAADEGAARAGLAALEREFPDATHHCWAWRLGPLPAERSSDAGEPGGTAGVPILQVLRGAQLSDILCVVVRWYGGTKLGKGGLARAYAGAARAALSGLATRTAFAVERLEITLPYELVGTVKRLLHPPEIELESEEYGERALLRLRVRSERRPALLERLADLGIGAGQSGAVRLLR